MFARKFLWVVGIGLVICLIAGVVWLVGSRMWTAHVLADWQRERESPTGSVRAVPLQNTDTFNSAATLGFVLWPCVDQPSNVGVEGPTTIERQDPVVLPGGRQQIEMEMVEMQMQGKVKVLGGELPVTIQESPDLKSGGKATQIKPGDNWHADSFFDIYVQVVIVLPGDTLTLVNREPVAMRAIIEWPKFPPFWVEYVPPPDFRVVLYNKATGAPWGCMLHPKHVTLPPVTKLVSIPDADPDDTIALNIRIENPLAQEAPLTIVDRLATATGSFLVDPGSIQASTGVAYLADGGTRLVWENDADPAQLDPVILLPRHQEAISFTAQVYAMPGHPLWNVVEAESAPLGLSASEPMTLTGVMPGGGGNLTASHKAAQPFVESGDLLTYSIALSNTGAIGQAHASLVDPIPWGTTYVPGSVAGGADYDPVRNAIVLYDAPIPPETTRAITFEVEVGLLFGGSCITNTATITDNWGHTASLHAWSVVVLDDVPAMATFEDQRDTFAAGSEARVRVRVVNGQGLNVPDGMAVTLAASGGTLSAGRSLVLYTNQGLVTATLTSETVQTVVVTAEVGAELVETEEFHFVYIYRSYLPLVVRSR